MRIVLDRTEQLLDQTELSTASAAVCLLGYRAAQFHASFRNSVPHAVELRFAFAGCKVACSYSTNCHEFNFHRRRRHHKFLPSITVTGTASRSKSFSSRELTPTRGFSKSGLPVDQSGDSE
jgi:hypothetical protein